MKILHFKKYNYTIIKEIDDTYRNIGYSKINNVKLVGRNHFNPNVLLYNNNLITPYDEKVMSLNKESFYDNNVYNLNEQDITFNYNNIISEPIFFFIYNFDNYYHFLYDTLPYLYTFLYLKKINPNLKLLVNYPNKYKNEFYKFNFDFLKKIINLDDIIIHNEQNIYSIMYVSSSLTHGGFSNNLPRKEIYEIYDIIKSNCKLDDINIPKKIYISRRTWKNNDKSNIGTDYTTRRKMINEDELVNELNKLGFVEIFAENLSTDEKINLFSNAEIIIGSIGGGMANLLFCNKKTISVIIVTPYFLDINYRFKYSLESSNYNYFYDVETYKENNSIPLFCRVKIKSTDKIGEIIEYNEKKYLINISNNDIVGFNNSLNYDQQWIDENDFLLLDKGLNSPFKININKIIEFVKII